MVIFNLRVDVTQDFTNQMYLHYSIFLLQIITNDVIVFPAIKCFPFTRTPNKMLAFHPSLPSSFHFNIFHKGKLLCIASIFCLFSISANDWFLILFHTPAYFPSHPSLLATKVFSTLWKREQKLTFT